MANWLYTTHHYLSTYVDENLRVKHSKHTIIVVMRHFKFSWMLLFIIKKTHLIIIGYYCANT